MPLWVFIAIGGYFLGAVTKVIDKVLLVSVISDPLVFTFFTGIVSVFAIVLVPFGLEPVGPIIALSAFVCGASFVAGLFFFFKALKKFEISRVVPIVAGVAPFATLIFSYWLLGERLALGHIFAVVLLVIGGVLLSIDPSVRRKFQRELFMLSCISALFLSINLVATKIVFSHTPFINGFIWTRAGIILATLSLLLLPDFWSALKNTRRPRPKNISFFLLTKAIGALSLIAISYALARGQASVIHALGGFEYVSAFILSLVASNFWPRVFDENKSPAALGIKFLGTLFLSAALAILSFQ